MILTPINTLVLSLYRMNRHNDAGEALKKALELSPENRELMFALAECYYNQGQSDPALKIFASLRTDAHYGAHSCIYAGTISMKFRNHEQGGNVF